MKVKTKHSELQHNLKRVIFLLKNNYLLIIFIGCVGFVGVVSFYKLFIKKPTYVYAKVRVGQGMWWASTQKPGVWFLRAIQQAKEQKDLMGKPIAKLLDVTYYPYYASGQYDIYVTVQLKVSKAQNMGTYNFNRETIGVSSPIDLEFPNVQFSGTILALSEEPLKATYVNKIVYLFKKNVNPWEFEQINIGDSSVNGKEKVFEVLGKERGETNGALLSDLGKQINWDTEPYRYVIVKAKIRIKIEDGQYVFGEEYVIYPGRSIPIATNNLIFNEYIIQKIE